MSAPSALPAPGTNVPPPEPTRQELATAAEAINRQATKKLNRLTQLLGLSEEQQDQVFPLLARSAPAYHPALTIEVAGAAAGGRGKGPDSKQPVEKSPGDDRDDPEPNQPLPGNEAEGRIHDVLSDEQKQLLEDELIEEDLWWTAIIADLEDELDESTQVVAEPERDPEQESEPVETGYGGNTGLGGLLQQGADQNSGASAGGAEAGVNAAPSTRRVVGD